MLFLLLLFSCFSGEVGSLNILVYSPSFANSHMIFMGQLADTLTDAGHNVTLLIPVADRTKRSVSNVKSTKDVVYVDHDDETKGLIKSVKKDLSGVWTYKLTAEHIKDKYSWFQKLMTVTCTNFLRNDQILARMQARRFDIAILEPLSVCGFGFTARLGIEKFVLTSSSTFFEFILPYIGETHETTYVPSFYSPHADDMGFMERYENYKFSTYLSKAIEDMFDSEEAVYKEFLGDTTPSWRYLLPDASLYFTNSNPFIDFPRPTIQKTIPIGGIGVDLEPVQLADEWDTILNRREKTMVITFGNVFKSIDMPIEWRDTTLRVCQSFPDVTFIWKYETNETEWAEHVDNVHFSKLVPRKGFLADNRITAFMTEAGLSTINDVMYSGKTAVLIPLVGDQIRNANMLSRHGGSVIFDKFDLDKFQDLKAAFDSVLNDETYLTTAQRMRELLRDQPNKPRDQLVRHVEFVAKHGPFPRMSPYGRHLNYFQRTSLDMFFLLYFVQAFVCMLILHSLICKFLL